MKPVFVSTFFWLSMLNWNEFRAFSLTELSYNGVSKQNVENSEETSCGIIWTAAMIRVLR